MNIVLYGHGGSRNHGCEAIVRSTIHLLGKGHIYTLLSERPDEDYEYGLDSILKIVPSRNPLPSGFRLLLYKIEMKLRRSDRVYYKYVYRSFIKRIGPCDLAIAVGGDNYCYDGMFEQFSVMNENFMKKGIPRCLWGCSIDPNRLNKQLVRDLKGFSFIYAREQITFQTLLSLGFKSVIHMPDPAFSLPIIEPVFPAFGIDYVGINVSPLIIKLGKEPGLILNSFIRLIRRIIEETNLHVLLVPHVVSESNDDREPLMKMYREFASTGRIYMVEDCNCMELKGYISKCRFFVAARTHASIASYSQRIPTLVIGYSVKSLGIAKDLFVEENHYVIPVQTIKDIDTLSSSFIWILENEEAIRNQLDFAIPQYNEGLTKIDKLIEPFE